MKDEMFGERVIRVRLSCSGESVDERNTEVLNIEEDIQGRDILTFKCPVCGLQHKSPRFG